MHFSPCQLPLPPTSSFSVNGIMMYPAKLHQKTRSQPLLWVLSCISCNLLIRFYAFD